MSTVNRLSENLKVLVYYEDDASAGVQLPADAQAATDNCPAGWIDFQEYEKGMAIYFSIAGANAASTIRIISNTTAAGAGTDHAVTGTTITTPGNINAGLETAMVEWTASDITDGDRYITADLNQAGADPLVVVFVLENPLPVFLYTSHRVWPMSPMSHRSVTSRSGRASPSRSVS